ncbi:response regulator [candidate division KSB1 bacterium]|nr:response regulator [candidate division KSB1 bacterium]
MLPFESQRVLLVDDSAEFRRSLVKIFLKAGFQVRAVSDGDAALEVVRQEAYPLIVTDLKMTGKSGLDLLREIKVHSPDSQVIIVTAAGDVDSYHEAMQMGVSSYLYKPIKRETILEAAKHALEKTHAPGAGQGGST